MRIVTSILVLALTACASTPESELQRAGGAWKYSKERISEAEWQSLKAETVTLPDAKVEETEMATKIVISGTSKQLKDTVMYMFTTPAHSGHPAAAKVTFPLNAQGQPNPDYAFHYAGSNDGFSRFVQGVVIGASVMAMQAQGK